MTPLIRGSPIKPLFEYIRAIFSTGILFLQVIIRTYTYTVLLYSVFLISIFVNIIITVNVVKAAMSVRPSPT